MDIFLRRLYANHVLANLVFVLVLLMGFLSYKQLPREQDPTINFNWIDITTVMPGASAEDMEKRVTDILEDAIRTVSDIKFVSSNSHASVSNILVRFNDDIDETTFNKRITDLRREIQNKEDELPEEAEDPFIFEITSSNAFPSATVLVTGPANDENLRRQAELVKKDIERMKGVDRVMDTALAEPELQILFYPERLEGLGISPVRLADSVAAYFRDISGGSVSVGDQDWLVRLVGTDSDPGYLARLPVSTPAGEIPLESVADVVRGREKPEHLISHEGRPAIMLAVTKKGSANTLELVERINAYVEERNRLRAKTGVTLVLADDQTEITRNALNIMQRNALLGLFLVLFVTWVFLGSRIAILTSVGIPFILAATFWFLAGIDQTLNVTVLLGVVISLGMLVDDAVVVVEGIFYRLQAGQDAMRASLESLREVIAPVTTAVLTTIAAFVPLMLLPGILGKYMLIIPLVVSSALSISLVEAYWMLPSHIIAANVSFARPSRIHSRRLRFLHFIRVKYTRFLVKVLRYPKTTLASIAMLFVLALAAVFSGQIRMEFFASDPVRLFYVNVEMSAGTPLEETLAKTLEVEARVRTHVRPDEARSIVSYAGEMFTETAPRQGKHLGQILVALNPRAEGLRSVDEMIESMRSDVSTTPGPTKLSFLRLAGGPPTSKPINIKVRGDQIETIRKAAGALQDIMRGNDAIRDISDDDSPGQMELVMKINHDAARRAGVDPLEIARAVRMLVDGEVVASMQDQGEELEVRLRARPRDIDDITELLFVTLPTTDGRQIPLRALMDSNLKLGLINIRHYNFRRAITVEADIDKQRIDTVAANNTILESWEAVSDRYPNISLDFSGELDDIQESMDAIFSLFLFGIGLMYAILGTQFRSYFQPLMILVTVPMAFTGVVAGLFITGNPLSLFTMYGVVALAGISVNAAIVLISAANARLAAGMSVLHATLYAARRRVIPILITSLTTIAGLFSLATGLGGHSLLWGPVATAIVWGLVVSTCLTLFVIPLLYRLFMRPHHVSAHALAPATET
ncbi:MAG: efflux RND transporter permease subunit [Gammaproteobacteria bacterium]|jgi:multidrug efflux pump subunit AcrB|nr:efflux RND transporter permease subunit [Gammaproteobacteria bacterium]